MPQTKLKPTMRDVARSCSVSAFTVSAVLNDRRSEVSAETRERVMKTVRDMGYRLTPAHSPGESLGVHVIGVIAGIPGSSMMNPGYFSSMFSGIVCAAEQRGEHVLLYTHDAFHANLHNSIRIYCDGRCDGLIVIAPKPKSELIAAIQERGLPFVVVGTTYEDRNVGCVDVDNVGAARAVVDYLIESGHRRIAFFGDTRGFQDDPEVPQSVLLRRRGYEQSLIAHGIPVEGATIAAIGPDDRYTYQCTIQMMRLPVGARPTAIFCWHDQAAIPCLKAIEDLGLRVPVDVSVVGFDNDPFTVATEPPLTTVQQPYREMARSAVEILNARIERRSDVSLWCLHSAELIVRRSVAPPSC